MQMVVKVTGMLAAATQNNPWSCHRPLSLFKLWLLWLLGGRGES